MHATSDLSAYLDRELGPADEARVRAHLETCRDCAARLGELRATATLIAALPAARPARSLVPQVTARWNWLRPVRSLSAVMSGAFVMVFLITAVAQSGSDLGGGPTSPFTREAPAGAPAAAPAAAPAPDATAGGAPETLGATAEKQAEDAARQADATGAALAVEQQPEPPSPLIWLAFSLFLAMVAGVAHWRLRAALA